MEQHKFNNKRKKSKLCNFCCYFVSPQFNFILKNDDTQMKINQQSLIYPSTLLMLSIFINIAKYKRHFSEWWKEKKKKTTTENQQQSGIKFYNKIL